MFDKSPTVFNFATCLPNLIQNIFKPINSNTFRRSPKFKKNRHLESICKDFVLFKVSFNIDTKINAGYQLSSLFIFGIKT